MRHERNAASAAGRTSSKQRETGNERGRHDPSHHWRTTAAVLTTAGSSVDRL